jgi:hypothetical protein
MLHIHWKAIIFELKYADAINLPTEKQQYHVSMNLKFLLTLWAGRVMKQQNIGHAAILENGSR